MSWGDPMSFKFAATAVALAALAPAASASAASFAWSYTGLAGYVVNASGTLDATPLGGGTYQVTSISGTWNGIAIAGLTGYAGDDELVYTGAPHVDYPGLAFLLANGTALNAYSDTSLSDAYACGAVGYCEIGPGVPGTSGLDGPDPIHQIDFSLNAIPEPGTWALMLLGFATIGLTMRRRRTAAA
jgi:hypothetical protein